MGEFQSLQAAQPGLQVPISQLRQNTVEDDGVSKIILKGNLLMDKYKKPSHGRGKKGKEGADNWRRPPAMRPRTSTS